MNYLSRLLYLADVVDNFNSVGGFLLVIIGAALLCATILCGIAVFDPPRQTREDTEEDKLPIAKFIRLTKRLAIAWALGLVLWIATPSSDTVYAIAASEVGEDVLRSKTTVKAVRALDKWLDEQLGEK